MKSLKDIEKITLEELEAVSLDETVAVPEGLTQRIRKNLDVRRTRRFVFAAGAAASVALVAGIGFGIARWQNEPEDTFDDPYLAYAELEKAFARMSGEIQKGLAMAEESEAAMDKVTSIFE